MEEYILALDYGTQSVRGIVFDPCGIMLWKKTLSMPDFDKPQPDWAEVDPVIYRDNTVQICLALKKEKPELFTSIRGITLASMRDCVVLVDEAGNALRPMILWMDERKNEKVRPGAMLRACGALLGARALIRENSRAGHTNYLRDHEPENWKKAYKVVMLTGYLNRWMLGFFKDSTSNQSGHVPFNSAKKTWSGLTDIKKYVFPIEKEKLIDLAEPGEIMGKLCPEARMQLGFSQEVLVIASAADKACETLGSGCLDSSEAVLSFGSQATVETMTDHYYELEQFVPSFPAAMPGCWNPELQVYRGFWMVSWFLKELEDSTIRSSEYPEQNFEKYLAETPSGNNGLVLYPYMGASVKYPLSSGTIMGLKDYHGKAHVYRAIIEGINYTLRWAVEKIEQKERHKIVRLCATGGGSRSEQICQLTADMFGRTVYTVDTPDATALGAAMLGYVAIGRFADHIAAAKAMVRQRKEYQPNAENAKLYDRLYKAYQLHLKEKIHTGIR